MEILTNRKRIKGFNAISLTDIIFLLVVFFLLSSSFVIQPGIKVRLPKSDTKNQTEKKGIVITVDKNYNIYVNDSLVNIVSLESFVGSLIKENPNSTIIIRTDEELEVKKLIKIMDKVKKVGGDKIVIATQPYSQS